MALTTILLDNDGTLVDTYNMILESFKHATQEVLGKQFSEAEYKESLRGLANLI